MHPAIRVTDLTKRFDEASDFVHQGLTREPNSALGHFLMGSVMLQKGNRTELASMRPLALCVRAACRVSVECRFR